MLIKNLSKFFTQAPSAKQMNEYGIRYLMIPVKKSVLGYMLGSRYEYCVIGRQ